MSKMKDSGIEWVGKIPIDWNVVPNKHVMSKKKAICPIYNGEDILSLTMKGVIIRDLDAGGKMPTSFNGYQKLQPGNLLMCLFDYDVTPRCIGLIKYFGLTSPAYSQFVMKNGNVAEYYYYYYLMIDNTKELLHLAKNLRHSFTEEQLGMINTPVPSIEEQIRIAEFLKKKCSEIDSLCADIEKGIEILEEYKKSVITEAVTKGLKSDVEMKDSGIEWIGSIPKHWEVKKGKYCFAQKSNRGNKESLVLLSPTQNYGVIPQELYEQLSGFSAVKLNEKTDFNQLRTVHKGAFVISLRSFQGGFEYSMYEGVVSTAYQVFYPTIPISDCYYKYLFKTQAFINKINSYTMSLRDGKPIAFADFGRTYIPVPPVKEQIEIANYINNQCSEIDTVIAEKKQQLETLAEYKKSVIYEYVTGKKEVPSEEVIIKDGVDKNAVALGIIADKLGNLQNGRIQLQKIQFLVNMIGEMNLFIPYYRYNHGPYDISLNSHIDVLLKNKWYQEKKNGAYILVKGEKHSEFLNIYKELIEKVEPEIDKLLQLLQNMNVLKTSRLERIATLYAAWNDFLLDGINPTDDQIIQEVMTNWTDNKRNTKYSTWQNSLNKMKNNGLIPKGIGIHTIKKVYRKEALKDYE